MFRTALVAAFVAAASAASWPMITVNSAGDIVLNSPAKAGSFQLNAATVTSAPTSSGTASRSTVTALDADTDAFIVNVPSSPATSAGYKLPTATEGRTIRFYNSGSGKGAYTIWTSSTSVFVNGGSDTTIDIASTTSLVTATATSSTNWVISQNSAASAANSKGYIATKTGVTAATTLTAAEMMNGFVTVTPSSAAVTMTTPAASSLTAADPLSTNGDAYEFRLQNLQTTCVAATDLSVVVAAGTSVTVPTDGTQVVVPGQTRIYTLYRTGSSAWTLITKSQYTILPSAFVAVTNGPTLVTATTTAVATANLMRWTEGTITATATKLQAGFLTYVNAYAFAGDSCKFINSGVISTTDNVIGGCWVTTDNTVTVTAHGGNTAASGVTSTTAFEINKNF